MLVNCQEVVSVIIPTRNRCNQLLRAIESVRSQTYTNLQIIVIDDASNDDTLKILNKINELDSRILIIRNEKPLGGGGARNIGIDAAIGRWVAFLDDDDLWLPDKINKQLKTLSNNKDAVACTCYYKRKYTNGINKSGKVYIPSDKSNLLLSNTMGGASVCIINTEALKNIRGFNTSLKSCQDWDLWIRISDLAEIVICKSILVIYNEHEDFRISTNLDSVYQGRRRFYLFYRHRMDFNIQKNHIAYLLYLRLMRSKYRGFKFIRKIWIPLILFNNIQRLIFLKGIFKFIAKL